MITQLYWGDIQIHKHTYTLKTIGNNQTDTKPEQNEQSTVKQQ